MPSAMVYTSHDLGHAMNQAKVDSVNAMFGLSRQKQFIDSIDLYCLSAGQ